MDHTVFDAADAGAFALAILLRRERSYKTPRDSWQSSQVRTQAGSEQTSATVADRRLMTVAAAIVPSMEDNAPGEQSISIADHERELEAALVTTRRYVVADWATSNLAVAIHTAADIAEPEHEAALWHRRAVVISAVRIFRLARAGMRVVAAGYESEALIFDRALMETKGRRDSALEETTGELARRWIESGIREGLTAAVQRGLSEVDPDRVKALYSELSGHAHPDPRALMTALARVGPDGRVALWYGPARTGTSDRSLFLYAWLAGEASEHLRLHAGIDLPRHAELAAAILSIAGRDPESDEQLTASA